MIHSFLHSIGFSRIRKNTDLYPILEEIVGNPDEHDIIRDADGNEVACFSKFVAPDLGISVFGNYIDDGEFRMEYYYPFLRGSTITTAEPVDIERHASQIVYSGICDDLKVGVTLIFFVENVMDIVHLMKEGDRPISADNTVMSALAYSGKILLPVNKTKKQADYYQKTNQERRNLLQQAKDGDHTAIESLTLNEMDTYSSIARRLNREDVFSIVESSFIPYGVESDQYIVLGEIQNFYKMKNRVTGEYVWILSLSCNELRFDVCVNENDLLGEPEIGRRFRGRVWLLGHLNFGY